MRERERDERYFLRRTLFSFLNYYFSLPFLPAFSFLLRSLFFSERLSD